ncbi:TolB family protein [Streptomyces hesseae]|uniref:WD40 domain-containing protein n=1 Tax=Streptomyces hesseae TaxID=3075519 RepID=A0ABU2SSS8_9ACTN|nr:hypothetical protein [Streptomyces sp. DSM 40473]MDT0450974.1 hypothetical protein [Streptomyces sp. DSM 40473]
MRRPGRLRHAALTAAAILACSTTVLPTATAAADTRADRPPHTERVSVTASGAQANNSSITPTVSADGRYVAFLSEATDLVPGGRPGRHLYVKDLHTGAVEQIAVPDSAGIEGEPAHVSISGDGRYVVFEGVYLLPDRAGIRRDVLVHDRRAGRTGRLLPDLTTPGDLSDPVISADGRHVAFASGRADLVPGGTNGYSQVYVRDLAKGTTKRVSVNGDGAPGNDSSAEPVISADGSRIGFRSKATDLATDLAPGQAPTPGDQGPGKPRYRPLRLHVYDQRDGTTRRASETLDGRAARLIPGLGISPDGRYVVFSSNTDGIVPGPDTGHTDVYVRDLETGEARRVSVTGDGSPADGGSYSSGIISADGQRVIFTSDAGNLVPGDTNNTTDVFAKDLRTGAVQRLSVASDGTQGNAMSTTAGADASGRTVAFNSMADNLVPGDTNATWDVFVRHTR